MCVVLQAAKLKEFVSTQRQRSATKDRKADWLLDHRALAVQQACLEHQISDALEGLIRDGHISGAAGDACKDELAIARQLLIEEAGEAQETTRHIHVVAQSVIACAGCSEEEADYLLGEIWHEKGVHQRSAAVLEEDASRLAKDIRCGLLPVPKHCTSGLVGAVYHSIC